MFRPNKRTLLVSAHAIPVGFAVATFFSVASMSSLVSKNCLWHNFSFCDRRAREFLRNGEPDEASALSCCNVLSAGNLSRPVAGILSNHQPGHMALAEHRRDFAHVDCT